MKYNIFITVHWQCSLVARVLFSGQQTFPTCIWSMVDRWPLCW